jgi:ATP-dependent DNA helicase PIF1
MRAQSNKWFADYLLRIGNGTEETNEEEYVGLPDDILVDSPLDDISIDALIDHVFPNLSENCTSTTYMREWAILSTRNEHVDTVSALMIERFPHTKHVYYSFDSVEDDPRNNYPHDFFQLNITKWIASS